MPPSLRKAARHVVAEPVREEGFGERLDAFFIAAVTTVLVIRTQLWLTNYPQLGGGGLHIAHLLYGGIFMVIAIWLLLIFLNRSIRTPAALIGGVGFGFFIDELGKFITSDNNYFFQPAAALIYLVFVGLFLAIRSLTRRRGLSPRESVANAVALLAAAATDDLDERGRRHALMLLERGDPADPLVASTRGALEQLALAPPRPPSRVAQLIDAGSARVRRLAARPRFPAAVCWIVGVWGLVSFLATLELVASLVVHRLGDDWSHLSFVNWASLASSTVSGALVGLGIRDLLLRHRREAAFRWFERALLVSIFVTRTFSFVESQFGAVFGVAVDVILLVCVRVLLRAEQHDAAPEAEGRTRGTSAAVTA